MKDVANLHAAEVNAAKVLARWLDTRRTTLETIALRGTWLDQDDVSALLGLSLPGIDEIAALLEIGRIGQSGAYDPIVVDTAPTGHTLRMLGMPALLSALAWSSTECTGSIAPSSRPSAGDGRRTSRTG